MNYKEYFKKEAQNLIFIELERPLTISLNNTTITLPKGDYPIDSKSLINIAQKQNNLTAQNIIDGMIMILGCDPDFPHAEFYLATLKKIPNIESYIIHQIEENKKTSLKRAIIYINALIKLNPKKEFQMNRIYLLMDYYQKTNLNFLQDEILDSLKNLADQYIDYAAPNFYLGEYYLDKDYDMAKHYLRRSLNDQRFVKKAQEYLTKIEAIESYDKAVDLLKDGYPMEALKLLIPHIEQNPNNLDAKYFAAVAYRELQNYHKALYYLQELLQTLETVEVLNEIGLNLAFLGYFNDAIEYFQRALKHRPQDSSIITNIGVCYLNLNDPTNAQKYFQLALQKNPNDEIARQWLNNLN